VCVSTRHILYCIRGHTHIEYVNKYLILRFVVAVVAVVAAAHVSHRYIISRAHNVRVHNIIHTRARTHWRIIMYVEVRANCHRETASAEIL
jgi:hypothetical protein